MSRSAAPPPAPERSSLQEPMEEEQKKSEEAASVQATPPMKPKPAAAASPAPAAAPAPLPGPAPTAQAEPAPALPPPAPAAQEEAATRKARPAPARLAERRLSSAEKAAEGFGLGASGLSGGGGGGPGGGGLGGGGSSSGIGSGGRGAGGLTMRAGARQLKPFYRQNYYASYLPDPQLRFSNLSRELAGRTPAAQVQVFQQQQGAAAEMAFDVERAGEIVAVAIARQLDFLGWEVGLEPLASMLEVAAKEFPPVDLSGKPIRFQISGQVKFWVAQETRGTDSLQVARLHAGVRIRGAGSTLFATSIQTQAEVSSQQVPNRTERPKQAASAALRQFVARLFADPRLDQALTEHIQQSR